MCIRNRTFQNWGDLALLHVVQEMVQRVEKGEDFTRIIYDISFEQVVTIFLVSSSKDLPQT
jgi:hypothetical protein